MTQALRNAFAQAAQLPDADQDQFAEWLLAELESERRWTDLFAASPDLLSRLAAEAIKEDERRETLPLAPDER